MQYKPVQSISLTSNMKTTIADPAYALITFPYIQLPLFALYLQPFYILVLYDFLPTYVTCHCNGGPGIRLILSQGFPIIRNPSCSDIQYLLL